MYSFNGFAIISLFFAARPALADPAARKLDDAAPAARTPSKSSSRSNGVDLFQVNLGSCTAGYVDCVNGNTVINSKTGSTTITCAAACGSDCCVESDACFAVTAKICRDGSCSGIEACYGAGKIDYIINSCKGYGSCRSVETVGYIKESCIGDSACGYAGGHGGKIGHILESCVGVQACYQAGYESKAVLSIESSCNGIGACFALLEKSGSTTMKNLRNCCNSDLACDEATQDTLPVTCSVTTLVRCS